MKKNLIAVLLAVFSVGFVQAQLTQLTKPTIAIHGSALAASLTQTSGDEEDEEIGFKTRIGYKGGITANFPVSLKFSIMPQLSYVSKGGKIDESGSIDLFGETYSYSAKGYARMQFLELPVHFVYSQQLAKGGSIFIGVGPSVSMGLGGKGKLDLVEEFDGEREESSHNVDLKFDGKKNTGAETTVEHYKRFEFGISAIGGYHFSEKLFVNVQFNQGLTNLNTDGADAGKLRTNYFGLGLGVYLGRK